MKLDTTALVNSVNEFVNARNVCTSGQALLTSTSDDLMRHIQALVEAHQKTLEELAAVKKERDELKKKLEGFESKKEEPAKA